MGVGFGFFLATEKKIETFSTHRQRQKTAFEYAKEKKNTKSKLNHKSAPMAHFDDVMSEDASCDEDDSVGSLVDFIADDMSGTEDEACVDDFDHRSELDQLRADLRPDEILEEDATEVPNTNGARRSRRRSVQPRRFLEEYAEDISRVLLEDIPPDEIDAAIHDDVSVNGDEDDEEYDEDQVDDDDQDDDDDDQDDDQDDGQDDDQDDDGDQDDVDEDQDDDDQDDVDEGQDESSMDEIVTVTTVDKETTTATNDGGAENIDATTSTTVPDLKQVHVDVDGAMTLEANVVETSPSTFSANLQWTREVQAQFDEVFPSRDKDASVVFSTPFSHPLKTKLPAMDESVTLELSLM